MTDRTVSVKLMAEVANYLAGMEKAREATAKASAAAEKLAAKKLVMDTVGKASLAMGLATAAGIAVAVAKFAEFDQAMSNVQAATLDTSETTAETTERMSQLSQAALEAGASTVFSATESANAVEELAKAGISAADVLGGALTGSLDLASAGELGVARAAEIAAITLQQFKLEGADAGHVADVLAAGAGKALGSVDDLANGLKFVAPVANSMGVSLEETTGVLSLFAQQGIIGEQAGTGLRGVLASLTSPASLASKEIEKLGITLYDSSGKFLGMENAAGELSKAYATMDDESRNASMGIIFGRETITAATTLYQAGAEGVAEWTEAVDESGYAAQVARDRLDNLTGDVEALGGAFDTALIQTGAAGNDVLRAMAQTLTNVIDLYNGAAEPVKVTTLAVLGVAAAAGIASGAFFLGAPKVAAFNASLATMGPNAQKAGAALTAAAGPAAIAFGAAAVVLGAFAGQQAAISANASEVAATLDKATGATTRYTRELIAQKLAESGAFEAAKEAGVSQKALTNAVLEGGDALEKVTKKIGGNNNLPNFFTGVGIRAGNANTSIKELAEGVTRSADNFDDQKAALDGSTDATDEATSASKLNAAALESMSAQAQSSEDSINDLAATIRGFADEALNARSASRDLEASYDTLTESIKANGTELDIGEEKGRANQEAIDGIAQAAQEAAAATLEQTGSQEKANEVLQAGRERLIEMLAQFGITGDAAEAYVDELGLIPVAKETAIKLDDAAATAALDALILKLNNMPTYKAIYIDEQIRQSGAPRGEVEAAYAEGGAIRGIGGPREDNIPIRASVGEHMFDAEDVQRMGGQDAVYRFRQSLYMADGGAVGYRSSGVYGSHAGTSTVTNNAGNKSVSAPISVTTDDPYLAATIIQNRLNKEMRGL